MQLREKGLFSSLEFQVTVHHIEEFHSGRILKELALSHPYLEKVSNKWCTNSSAQITFFIHITHDSLPT